MRFLNRAWLPPVLTTMLIATLAVAARGQTFTWMHQFGTASPDYAQGVAVDSSGAVYVVGATSGDLAGSGNSGGYDIFIRKFDSGGNLLWTKQYGTEWDDFPDDVAAYGGYLYVVATHSKLPWSGGPDRPSYATIFKYDADGVPQVAYYKGVEALQDRAASVAVNATGVYFARNSRCGSAYRCGLVDRLDASLNLLGTINLSVVPDDFLNSSAYSVALSGGSVYVTGSVGAIETLRKYDVVNGELAVAWKKELTIAQAGVSAADDTGVYVAGIDPTTDGISAAVGRYSSLSGDVIWTRQFGASSSGHTYVSAAADDGAGVYVVGYTDTVLGASSAGSYDAYIRQYDANGNVLRTIQFGTAGFDMANGVTVDTSGVYVAGGAGSLAGANQGPDDAFVAKVPPADFSLSSVPPITMNLGGSGSSTVTVNSIGGFSGPVWLTLTPVLAGMTMALNPDSVTPLSGGSASSTLTVTSGPSLTAGVYTLKVNGDSQTQSHSTAVSVTVKATTGSVSAVIGAIQAAAATGGGACIDNSGVASALQSKLDEANAYLAAGNIQAAISSLNALLNQLQAQQGKHIAASCTAGGVTFDPIAVLTADVQALIAGLKP